ncbi:superoxide dismutase [Candidatus Woesearchaeota archaeon]|nr:superoxide dismutase [Candidatus Woesearchaeota archaeon]
MAYEIKPLKYKSLAGLSEKQLSEHHDVLYAGYVKKVNEIREKLSKADLATANGTYSDLRELKVEETFAVNGVKLHEGYFDIMGGDGKPNGPILKWIEADFGSFEKWTEEFKALGLCARGWVVLAFDLYDGKLHNYVCDTHNQGGIWGAVPLLILDVYEHAYFVDYATARKKYTEAFMAAIDWKAVNAVIQSNKLQERR